MHNIQLILSLQSLSLHEMHFDYRIMQSTATISLYAKEMIWNSTKLRKPNMFR